MVMLFFALYALIGAVVWYIHFEKIQEYVKQKNEPVPDTYMLIYLLICCMLFWPKGFIR